MARAAARHVKCLKLFVPEDFSSQRQLLAAAKCSVIILYDYLYLKETAQPVQTSVQAFSCAMWHTLDFLAADIKRTTFDL